MAAITARGGIALVLLLAGLGCGNDLLEVGRVRGDAVDGGVDGDRGGDATAPAPPDASGVLPLAFTEAEQLALCKELECPNCRVMGGRPVCLCAPSELSDGRRCVTCTKLDGGPELLVPGDVAAVSARVTVNGVAADSSAILRLRHKDGMVTALAVDGKPRDVPLGRYEVSLDANAIPANRGYRLPPVVVDGPKALVFDIAATRVTGTVDYGPEHERRARELQVTFISGESRATALYTDADRRRFEVWLVPGAYQLGLAGPEHDTASVGLMDVNVPEPGEPIDVTLVVPTRKVTVDLTVNGQPPFFQEDAFVVLQGPLSPVRLQRVGPSHRYEAHVVATPELVYTLSYGLEAGALLTHPLQIFAHRFARFHPIRDMHFAMDLPLIRLSGRVLVQGKVPERNAQRVWLQSPELGAVNLRLSDQGLYEEWVMPGSYLLNYWCQHAGCSDGVVWPANRTAFVSTVVVKDSATMNFDIQSVPVQIDITENGKALVPGQEGVEFVRIGLSPDRVTDGPNGGGSPVVRDGASFATRLVPGAYDVTYLRSVNGQEMRWTVKNALPLVAGPVASKVNYDLPLVRFTGQNGVARHPGWRWLRFENPEFGHVNVEADADGRFAADLIEGNYLFYYGELFTFSDKNNLGGLLGCYSFTRP